MKERFGVGRVFTLGLAIFVTDTRVMSATDLWPQVTPISRTFHLVDHHQTGVRLIISDPHGAALYLLECYLNAYDREDPNFDYSGAFECRLTSTVASMNEGYSTLLTDGRNPTRDWESRGRFLLQELTGPCAAYPEWGAVRHFRLRGMELTLAVSSVTIEAGSQALNRPWAVDRIGSLDLKVEVVPDPQAVSAVAEPTEFVEPPYARPGDASDLSRDCGQVVIRKNARPTQAPRKEPQ